MPIKCCSIWHSLWLPWEKCVAPWNQEALWQWEMPFIPRCKVLLWCLEFNAGERFIWPLLGRMGANQMRVFFWSNGWSELVCLRFLTTVQQWLTLRTMKIEEKLLVILGLNVQWKPLVDKLLIWDWPKTLISLLSKLHGRNGQQTALQFFYMSMVRRSDTNHVDKKGPFATIGNLLFVKYISIAFAAF